MTTNRSRIAAMAAPIASALLAACVAPDPGALTFVERARTSRAVSAAQPDSGSTAAQGDDDAGDAAALAQAISAFSEAAPYAPPNPATPSSDNANHGGDGNPAGQDCMQCHGSAGPGPRWLVGGTVFDRAGAGGAPLAAVEVRIANPSGGELARAYTNADGNFWVPYPTVPAGAEAIPSGSYVGIRDATRVRLMDAVLAGTNDGACQRAGCHVGGGGVEGRVHLE